MIITYVHKLNAYFWTYQCVFQRPVLPFDSCYDTFSLRKLCQARKELHLCVHIALQVYISNYTIIIINCLFKLLIFCCIQVFCQSCGSSHDGHGNFCKTCGSAFLSWNTKQDISNSNPPTASCSNANQPLSFKAYMEKRDIQKRKKDERSEVINKKRKRDEIVKVISILTVLNTYI